MTVIVGGVTDPVNEPSAKEINGVTVGSDRGWGPGPILALALALRLLLPVSVFLATSDPAVFHASDTGSYWVLAESLLRAGRFGVESTPEITRTPGYPILLIPGLLLGKPEAVTIAFQVALSIVSVYLVFRLTQVLFRQRKIAWTAAFMYALEPLSVIYASKLLSETLFTTLVIATLYCLGQYVRTPTLGRALTAALGLAVAAYVRPIAYFLPIVVALCLVGVAIRRRQRFSVGRTLAHALLLVVVAMALTGVWRVRNWLDAEYPGFAAVADVNLYFYLGASVRGALEGVPYYEMQRRMGYADGGLYLRLHPEQTTWGPARRFAYMRGEGRRILLSAPLTYGRIHLDGMLRTLVDPGATDLLDFFKLDAGITGYLGILVDEGVWRGVARLFRTLPFVFWSNLLLAPLLGAYLALAALALASRAVRADETTVVVLAVAIYLLVIAGGPAAYARLRHPIMPIVCVYAAYGLNWLRCRFGAARKAGAGSDDRRPCQQGPR